MGSLKRYCLLKQYEDYTPGPIDPDPTKSKIIMNKRVEEALNDQIKKEASSSQYYLAMASWAESNGLNGTASFMYTHSDEERFHMLKLVKFVNERGGRAVVPQLEKPPHEFKNLKNVFQNYGIMKN